MNRRDLLKLAAAAPLLTVSARLLAAPSESGRVLVVFLRGGYDAANLLVPAASPFYYEVRPNIAIPRPGSDANAALPLDAEWALHPALRDSIYPLWQKQQVVFIPFAGSDDLTRSHFETQDSIELGQPLTGSRNFQSGFLNRLGVTLNGARPIAFTAQLPVVLRGAREIPNIALRSLGKSAVDERQSAIIASMYQKTTLANAVTEGFGVRANVMAEMSEEMQNANRGAISARGFEAEARRIAKLMKDRFNIGFVDVGGWDTHVGQGASTGYLAGRLEELGRALVAYSDEMGPRWRDTVVIVISEFGRTFRENGNRGTDHGHGTVYWVLGGGIRGGRIAGDQIRIEQGTLFQNRDYPVLNEYRALLGALLARMYGLSTAQVASVFPDVQGKDIGLV
jgi:uncharacterized protein (DUF1501 family)